MAVSREQAVSQIRGFLASLNFAEAAINHAISKLYSSLPGRVSTSEYQAAAQQAKQYALQYERISTGSGSGSSAGEGSPEVSPSEAVAQGVYDRTVGLFRDGGWENPDYWASKFLSYVAPSGYLPFNSDQYKLIETIAGRWGSNPELGWQFLVGNVEPGGPEIRTATFDPGAQNEDLLSGILDGFGGFGGGSAAPVYTPPDRRLVEDMVRGQLSRLVGKADDARIQKLTDLYMSEHKRSWNDRSLGLDPAASVTETIRSSSDYKRIHALRPDFVDENEWVPLYQSGGVSAGMSAQQAERFAIQQATVGTKATSIKSVAGAQEMRRGQQTPEYARRFAAVATGMMRRVR